MASLLWRPERLVALDESHTVWAPMPVLSRAAAVEAQAAAEPPPASGKRVSDANGIFGDLSNGIRASLIVLLRVARVSLRQDCSLDD
jgi:hypothetical protein